MNTCPGGSVCGTSMTLSILARTGSGTVGAPGRVMSCPRWRPICRLQSSQVVDVL